jgi:uncharacterized protein
MDIQLEFLSERVLAQKTMQEKMDYILEHIQDNRILVIEEGMSPLEESALISATMEKVSRKFSGIEVSTLRDAPTQGIRDRIIRLLGGKTGGLTVIGPSKLVKQIRKDPTHISLLAGGQEEDKKAGRKRQARKS